MTTVDERLAAFPTLQDALDKCPERDTHADQPVGYIQWHAWAEKKKKTHRQVRCQGCGRYLVIVPKSR